MLPNRYAPRVKNDRNNEERISFKFSSLGQERRDGRWHRGRRSSSAGISSRQSNHDETTRGIIDDFKPGRTSSFFRRSDTEQERSTSYRSRRKIYPGKKEKNLSSPELSIDDKKYEIYNEDIGAVKMNRKKGIKKDDNKYEKYKEDNRASKMNRQKGIKKARSDILDQLDNHPPRSTSRVTLRPRNSRSISNQRSSRQAFARSLSTSRPHIRVTRSVSRRRPDLY